VLFRSWYRGDRMRGSCFYYAMRSDERAWADFLYNDRRVRVAFSWYSPGYGGRRYFFLCPKCQRRARTLHFKEEEIACRLCHNLTYRSCNEYYHFDSLYKLIAVNLKSPWQVVKGHMDMRMKAAKKEPKRPRGRPRKT